MKGGKDAKQLIIEIFTVIAITWVCWVSAAVVEAKSIHEVVRIMEKQISEIHAHLIKKNK